MKAVAKKSAKPSPKKAVKKVVKATKPVKKQVSKKAAKPAVKKAAKKVVAVKAVKKAAATKRVATVAPKKPVKAVVKKAAPKKAAATKFVAHSTHLQPGDVAPAFKGVDQNGNVVDSVALAGKTIILYFYPKDDTPGCTATACSLRDEYQYLSDKNYAVVGVSADDEKSHKKFAAKYSLPFPLLADTQREVMKAYNVWGKKQFMGRIFDGVIRTTFVIGPDGILKQVIKSVDTANHAKQIMGE